MTLYLTEPETANVDRITTLAEAILEDKLQDPAPQTHMLLADIEAQLSKYVNETIPPAWHYARAAFSACSGLIHRFGPTLEFWEPWLIEIRTLARGLNDNSWKDADQVRFLAQSIPFYRDMGNPFSLEQFSEVQRAPLFPMLSGILEDRYSGGRRFAIESEISSSAFLDDDPQRDSFCSLLLLESEVRVYGRLLLTGGPDSVAEPAQKQTLHLNNLLQSLIAACLGRHALWIYQATQLPDSWRGIELRLRSAFVRLIQRTPMRDSVVPNQGTHDYARTGTRAATVVSEQYRKIFFTASTEATHVQIVPVSSGMAAVSLVLSALATAHASDQDAPSQPRILELCFLGWTYFETRNLLRKLWKGRIETVTVGIDSVDAISANTDVLFLEPFSNQLETVGQGIDAVQVISQIVDTTELKTFIVDKTTDPFCLDGIESALSDDVLVVSVESLSKYLQYGDAFALGGAISLIARKDSAAAKRVDDLYDTILQYSGLQGQHMDPRLAWSLAPTRCLLEWRITRMRRNAMQIARALRDDNLGKVCHSEITGRVSTLIYVEFKLREELRKEISKILKAIESHAMSQAHKSTGDKSYELTFGSNDLARDLFYKYISHRSRVRLSTSFGFSLTSMTFVRGNGAIFVRISAGCEPVGEMAATYRQILRPILVEINSLT